MSIITLDMRKVGGSLALRYNRYLRPDGTSCLSGKVHGVLCLSSLPKVRSQLSSHIVQSCNHLQLTFCLQTYASITTRMALGRRIWNARISGPGPLLDSGVGLQLLHFGYLYILTITQS